ncbi:hypothetical protein [Cupriavidus sp. PET2-C1]
MATSNVIVNPVPELAPSAVIEAFQSVVTPHISDNLQRLSERSSRLIVQEVVSVPDSSPGHKPAIPAL